MTIEENIIRELLDQATPGPWEYEGQNFKKSPH